ncbi:hypothetical protein RUND412_004682 [Rhizina undulata]
MASTNSPIHTPAEREKQSNPSYYPSLYNFPPFFKIWQRFILDYCRDHKIWELWYVDKHSDLFYNKAINRISPIPYFAIKFFRLIREYKRKKRADKRRAKGRLKLPDIREIIEDMVKKKTMDWPEAIQRIPKENRNSVLVWWYSVEEWADIVYKSMEDKGQTNGTVVTEYELLESGENKKEEYSGMDMGMFNKVIKCLQTRQLVTLFRVEGVNGYKFHPRV